MGTQIVEPTGTARTLVVIRLAGRLHAAIGDWRKYGDGAESLVADALAVALGPPVLRTIMNQLNNSNSEGRK